MSKKSMPNRANKGNSSSRAQKPGREEPPKKENSSMQSRARKQSREEEPGNESGYRQQIKEKNWLKAANPRMDASRSYLCCSCRSWLLEHTCCTSYKKI